MREQVSPYWTIHLYASRQSSKEKMAYLAEEVISFFFLMADHLERSFA